MTGACAGCGQPLTGRSHRLTCSPACRKRAERARRVTVTARPAADAALRDLLEHTVWVLRRDGRLDPEEALLLVALPSQRTLDALLGCEVVA